MSRKVSSTGRKNGNGIGGVKQRLSILQTPAFVVRSGQLCKPQRQADGAVLQLCSPSHELEHLADGGIVAGQNVAFTKLSAFGTGEKAICHIPHIHKVISAANG